MALFRRKVSVEDFMGNLLDTSLPRAITFFNKENQQSRHRVNLNESNLVDIGAGLCLFYLAIYFPENKSNSDEIMSRAYRLVRRKLGDMGGRGDNAHAWWKSFTDSLIFQQGDDQISIASRIIWDKLFPNSKYQQGTALKGFSYFLKMEVEAGGKLKLI